MAEAHYVHDLRPVYEQTPWRVQMPQDLILGGACHPIDLLRWFMGDIAEVHCYGLRSGVSKDYPQEDTFVINVKFTSGKIGRVANFLGVIHPPDVPMNSLTVYGTKGTILDGKVRLDADEWLPQRDATMEFPSQPGHSGEMIVMLQHMADCVLNGATPWVGAREGARVVSTCLSAWDSLRSGQPAEVRTSSKAYTQVNSSIREGYCMTDTIQQAGDYLASEFLARRPLDLMVQPFAPSSVPEAYAIQEGFLGRVAEERGTEVWGYKIAYTNAFMRNRAGVDGPCSGLILASNVHKSGVTLHRDDYVQLGIECEVTVRMGADLPASGAPYTRESVLDTIEWLAASFEIIERRHPVGWSS